jgi:hypothetical protein
MVKVYYISGMDARMAHRGEGDLLLPLDEYVAVCEMDIENPYDAYQVCQNVDSDWWENPTWSGVEIGSFALTGWGDELVRRGGLRSMMPGDIVEHVQDGEVRYYLCCSVGWAEVWRGWDDCFHGEGDIM